MVGLSLLAVGAVIYWITASDGGESPSRPNILVISLDTVRADHMGFLGMRLPDGSSPTPHLDALAERCAAMREGVTPAPLTLPAHVSLMSGLYPDRHGVRENDSFRVAPRDQREFTLLAEALRDVGYRTGAVVSGQPLEARYGLDAGFGTYKDPDASDNPVDRLRFREQAAPETTRFAMNWIDRAGEDEPWFLFAHYFDAHDPYLWHGPHPGLDPENRKHRYLSEIMFLDHWVGQLIAALPDGGRDIGIFVFADHGEGLGDHGEETHGFTLHQSTLRVPFLFKPPEGVDASAFSEEGPPGRLVDVAPTVLALAGAEMSGDLDGRNLLDAAPSEWHAFAETLYPYYQFQYAHDRCCQDREHKLITGGGRQRLYDWTADPAESKDLAPVDGARVTDLTRWLNAHLTRPGRGKAIDVVVEPNESFPYMGGRPLALPVEPRFDDNQKLPPVETKWPVIQALDRARQYLAAGSKRAPHRASEVLAPFAGDLDENPALLWWTARARQLESRNEQLAQDTRLRLKDQCIALYERHYRQFDDGRALDALLWSMLKRETLAPSPASLKTIVQRVDAEEGRGRARALTVALRAQAHERLGNLKEAEDDLRKACRLETDPVQRRRMSQDLKNIQAARRTARGR